ncbi:Nucleotidylyl transferase [Agrocybe pediades]|nr:Nucleotidylyl transferase [Agrocybe pediades]
MLAQNSAGQHEASTKGKGDEAAKQTTSERCRTPHFLIPVIDHAAKSARKRLIIVLFSRHFNVQYSQKDPLKKDYLTFPEISSLSRTASWDAVQRLLTFIYVQATKVAYGLNNVLMEIDVLLKGFNEDVDPNIGNSMDICFRVTGDSIATPLPESVKLLRQAYLRPGEREMEPTMSSIGTPNLSGHTLPPTYPVTALGGTFDHLHSGHKILLSMGAYITSKKLIVGMTDDVLLQNKSNKHILQSFPVRKENVRKFLNMFKPDIIADIVPIDDVYGPTGWDPDVQALVVSKETVGGAEAIAKHRAEKNLPPLQPFLIDVISATSASLDHEDVNFLKEHKLGSSYIRQWIVDNNKQVEKEEARLKEETTS